MLSTLPQNSDVHLVGRSEAIRTIETDLENAAHLDVKILVTGETGVGKEVVARLVHRRSTRAAAPLVTLNCAGLPDSLLESELFGHVKGSFTGAYRDKPGLLKMADWGTLFLDEIGEMSTRMQVVLLRFLETGEIQRVGADRSHGRVNVRLITATNRDLQLQIKSGAFREDLFFRLNVIHIHVPPLREHGEDIPLLVDYFLHSYSKANGVEVADVCPDVMDALLEYRWPGNVRELKNVVERLVVKTRGRSIAQSDLPTDMVHPASVTPATHAANRNGTGNGSPTRLTSQAEHLALQMLKGGESFWSAVHPLFMSRDMTRADLRKIVQMGLERTSGNYRMLVGLFNMPEDDYKRFLSFLRKHDCHLPFQRFRAVPARFRRDASPSEYQSERDAS